jgi:hypothetical protein
MTFSIQDMPMSCCGMLEAQGFSSVVHEPGNAHYANDADREEFFKRIDKHQREGTRNCALISLSEEQKDALRQAKKSGFQIVFEFYNPNSGNQVYLLTKTLWSDDQDYQSWKEEN